MFPIPGRPSSKKNQYTRGRRLSFLPCPEVVCASGQRFPSISPLPGGAGRGPMVSPQPPQGLISPTTRSPSRSLAIFQSSWVTDYLLIPCPRKLDPPQQGSLKGERSRKNFWQLLYSPDRLSRRLCGSLLPATRGNQGWLALSL